MQVNKNIRLVDDDATACHALSVFLESSGYSVRSFISAETFLEEGVSERTIEAHRSMAMKKMRAESIPDLVRKCAMCLKDNLKRPHWNMGNVALWPKV